MQQRWKHQSCAKSGVKSRSFGYGAYDCWCQTRKCCPASHTRRLHGWCQCVQAPVGGLLVIRPLVFLLPTQPALRLTKNGVMTITIYSPSPSYVGYLQRFCCFSTGQYGQVDAERIVLVIHAQKRQMGWLPWFGIVQHSSLFDHAAHSPRLSVGSALVAVANPNSAWIGYLTSNAKSQLPKASLIYAAWRSVTQQPCDRRWRLSMQFLISTWLDCTKQPLPSTLSDYKTNSIMFFVSYLTTGSLVAASAAPS